MRKLFKKEQNHAFASVFSAFTALIVVTVAMASIYTNGS